MVSLILHNSTSSCALPHSGLLPTHFGVPPFQKLWLGAVSASASCRRLRFTPPSPGRLRYARPKPWPLPWLHILFDPGHSTSLSCRHLLLRFALRRFSSRTRPPFGCPSSHPSKTPLRSPPQPMPPAVPRNSPAGGIGQLTLQIKTRLNWFLEIQSKATFKRVGRYGRLHFCGSPPTLQKYNFLFHGFC